MTINHNRHSVRDCQRFHQHIHLPHLLPPALRVAGFTLRPSVCLKFQGSKVEYDQSESECVGSLLEIIVISAECLSVPLIVGLWAGSNRFNPLLAR